MWAWLIAGRGASVDLSPNLFQVGLQPLGYVGSAVDVFGVGWCAGFGVESPGAAAFVRSVAYYPGGVSAGLVTDHAVVSRAGGCEVVDVGETAFCPVLLGVVEFDVGGGLVAAGCRAHFPVGAGEGDEALFAGREAFAAPEM